MAKDLGVNHETLRTWVKAVEKAGDPGAVAGSAMDTEIARRSACAQEGPPHDCRTVG
ncbi:hypothetical protein DY245_28015 [Streptomyces inhibens]|uniref:Transposase n=1 Tax=Streptomyces inhibens TaxID=2293571 RepID=A0A371PY43_STRIH|nr:hypothetical protein DY245_28015 [Streptomyces inhibens]